MRTVLIGCATVILFAAESCTYNEPRIRPEPVSASPLGTLINNQMTVDGVTFRCVETHSVLNKPQQYFLEFFTGWHSTMDECVYLTADPKSVLGGADETASQLGTNNIRIANKIAHKTDTLLAISDYNCANFLAGAFAAKTGTDFGSSIASTILSGTSSILGLAGGVPALVPAALSGGNSAITGGTAAFDSNFYAKQSFDIMETGILASRQVQRAQIAARICETYRELGRSPVKDCGIQPRGNYEGYIPTRYWTMSEAVSDVIEYDRTCSIEGGLRELSGDAAQSKKKADDAAGVGAALAPSANPSEAPASPAPTGSPGPAASPAAPGAAASPAPSPAAAASPSRSH